MFDWRFSTKEKIRENAFQYSSSPDRKQRNFADVRSGLNF